MLQILFECPCFGYGREQRYTRRFILGEGVLGERRCAGKRQRWCCWPEQRRASGHWQNEIVLRSQGTRWRDASHLDGGELLQSLFHRTRNACGQTILLA